MNCVWIVCMLVPTSETSPILARPHKLWQNSLLATCSDPSLPMARRQFWLIYAFSPIGASYRSYWRAKSLRACSLEFVSPLVACYRYKWRECSFCLIYALPAIVASVRWYGRAKFHIGCSLEFVSPILAGSLSYWREGIRWAKIAFSPYVASYRYKGRAGCFVTLVARIR